MQYSNEVKNMVCINKGPKHGPAPIPEEGKWVEVSQDGLNWNFVSVVTTLKDYERLKRKLVEEYRLVRLIAVIKTAKKRT